MVQGLMGQEETVVQHIEPPEEVCVNFHLPKEPGSLLVCTHADHITSQLKQNCTAHIQYV